MNLSTPLDYITRLYDAVASVVDEHIGQAALAESVGMARQTLNLRLRRDIDSKGDLQRLHVDVLGHVLVHPAARWALLERLCAICGAKPPEPVVAITDAEKVRLLAAELSGERLRRLERERGLPPGTLG